jgi:hypothetical protein
LRRTPTSSSPAASDPAGSAPAEPIERPPFPQEYPMITFLKRALDAYIDGVGRYPIPLVWTF